MFRHPAACQGSFNAALREGADPPALSAPINHYRHHPHTVPTSCGLAETHLMKIRGKTLNMGKSVSITCVASMDLPSFGCMSRRDKAKPRTQHHLLSVWSWSKDMLLGTSSSKQCSVVSILGSFPPTRNSLSYLPSHFPPPYFRRRPAFLEATVALGPLITTCTGRSLLRKSRSKSKQTKIKTHATNATLGDS